MDNNLDLTQFVVQWTLEIHWKAIIRLCVKGHEGKIVEYMKHLTQQKAEGNLLYADNLAPLPNSFVSNFSYINSYTLPTIFVI